MVAFNFKRHSFCKSTCYCSHFLKVSLMSSLKSIRQNVPGWQWSWGSGWIPSVVLNMASHWIETNSYGRRQLVIQGFVQRQPGELICRLHSWEHLHQNTECHSWMPSNNPPPPYKWCILNAWLGIVIKDHGNGVDILTEYVVDYCLGPKLYFLRLKACTIEWTQQTRQNCKQPRLPSTTEKWHRGKGNILLMTTHAITQIHRQTGPFRLEDTHSHSKCITSFFGKRWYQM